MDLADLYGPALLRAGAFRERSARGEVHSTCPWTIDQLLEGDIPALLAVLKRD